MKIDETNRIADKIIEDTPKGFVVEVGPGKTSADVAALVKIMKEAEQSLHDGYSVLKMAYAKLSKIPAMEVHYRRTLDEVLKKALHSAGVAADESDRVLSILNEIEK